MRRVLDNAKNKAFDPKGYLIGKLLVATPFITDGRFEHAVIYLCGHDEYGAIGLIINKPLLSLTFADLLSQLEIPISSPRSAQMHTGGHVEVSRGFVLHSNEYKSEATVQVGENMYITATLDILRTLAHGQGPKNFLIMLGYAGWGSGQLEQEITDNSWMIVDPTEELVFHTPIELQWKAAMSTLGVVNPMTLNMDAGRA